MMAHSAYTGHQTRTIGRYIRHIGSNSPLPIRA
jgi:hypothetical protein